MNIVQVHDRVRFWLDTVASARFESDDIDQGLNAAITDIVDEKYDQTRLNHRGDSFQRTQRVRDELSSITKVTDTDGAPVLAKQSGYVLVTDLPDDYRYQVGIAIFVADQRYNAYPLTYDRKNVIEKNPYRRVRSRPNVKCYYIESDQGLKVYHPFDTAAPQKVEVAYLAQPAEVFYGFEKTAADTMVAGTTFLTALNPTSFDSVEYKSGEELITTALITNIDYGLAVIDFVDPNINGFLHEEIARKAALNCLLSAKDFEKYKSLKGEIIGT